MNKLTKVGCSALCGSLAAISAANAGDLTVTGGADLTYLSIGAETTGNPIGMGSNINFKGSGELDNGWTFSVTTALANASAFSAANISLTMGGAGTINFNQGNSGNGIKALDDKMPTAWEEAWGTGLNPGIKLVCGSCLSNNVMYSTPKMAGTTFTFTLAPDYGSSDTADKATSNTEDNSGSSYDATININPSMGTELLSGLNFFAGASTIESYNNSATEEDQYQAVGGITFDIGPVSLGWQVSGLSLANVDYSGGIITTDWYNEGTSLDESIKITVRFLTNEIRSDGLKIIVHKKRCDIQQKCTINKISSSLEQELQVAILKKAVLFDNEYNKTKKKYKRKNIN